MTVSIVKMPWPLPVEGVSMSCTQKCTEDLVNDYISMVNAVDCDVLIHEGVSIRLGDIIHLDDILESDIDHHFKNNYINQIYQVVRIRNADNIPDHQSYYVPSVWIRPLFDSSTVSITEARPYKLESIVFTLVSPGSPTP